MRVYKNINRHIFALLIAVTIFMLQGCSMPGLLREAGPSAKVTTGEVIIVGTIELTPGLIKDEQKLDAEGVIDLFGAGDMNKNRALIQLNSATDAGGAAEYINPVLGEPFAFVVPVNLKYVVEGYVVTEFTKHGYTGKIHLPVDFKLDIQPSDKAIYIGHIRYERDDFNSITRVELKDDYVIAEKMFRKQYGSKYKLRKSLIQQSQLASK